MPTWRKFTTKAFRCGLYEAQDVLVETDSVDVIGPEPGWRFQLMEHLQRTLLYHDVTRKLAFLNPGLGKVRLAQEYELFVGVCQNWWDLLYLNAIEGWEQHCRTSVCWLDEVWAASLPDYKYLFRALERFDHIFVGTRGSVGPLSKAIGKSCRWLPGAVDALRFTPSPNALPRVIDVYSIGRRWDGIHRTLLRAAERGEIFYIYDTFEAANSETTDPQEHRELFANIAKRSCYFLVAPPKMDTPGHTHGQVEIGYRYFEGAAAGTVMIGQAPKCAAFGEMFPWPDAVVEVHPDGSDVRSILASMRSEPARHLAIGRRNATEALLRHDWIYRWKEVFSVAGIEPSEYMATRQRRLKDLAERRASANEQ
jgi:Glycosyl transferases group 1